MHKVKPATQHSPLTLHGISQSMHSNQDKNKQPVLCVQYFFPQNNCRLLFCCNFKSVWLPWRGVLFLRKRLSRANERGYKHHYILSVILVFTAGNVRNLCSNLLWRLTFKVTEEAAALMPCDH